MVVWSYRVSCCLLAVAMLAAGLGARADNVGNVGTRLELFVDAKLIQSMENVRLVMHNPTPREIAFTPDAPWEGSNSAYFTVFKDGDRYRMYYRGCGAGDASWEFTCLAESKDGVAFTRPDLGLFEYGGSKHNNIIYKGRGNNFWESHNFTAFKDTNPDCKPEEQYKAVAFSMLYAAGAKPKHGLGAFASPDGVRWKQMGSDPVFSDGAFDSQNVAFWDTNRNEYALYFRPNAPLRTVSRAVSKDFIHWTNPKLIDLGDSVPEQLYTNAITPYCRDSYWYIGLPMRFVSPKQRNTVGPNSRKTDGLSDAVLITSRDGAKFDRTFMEAFIRPGLNPDNWGNAHASQTPAWGIMQTSPEELSVYWSENCVGAPRIRRGTLRTDGFASVNAPYAGGEFVTKPITFSGKSLVINYSTSAVGSVRVEIRGADGKLIPRFGLRDCREIWGDEIERTVSWEGRTDLSSLAGKPVRLRFVMKDADLYSYRFR